MAFLRFHRDKRGYEHFYLVEATTNRRGKSRARVLYWFRTPPNVKVGREPFDDDVRRALEAQYPGVAFDWRKISDTPIPSADAERWRERRRLERAAKASRRALGEAEPASAEIPEDDDGLELPESAQPDTALDAAEQQADALAPTEESLISTAATVDAPLEARESREARETPERQVEGHRRRRRRRKRHHIAQPLETKEPIEPREPSEPLEPRAPSEPSEPSEPRGSD